jgi:hypothetical protein
MPVCGLPKHVTGQKKTHKIHGSLAISPANTQNVAQQKEGPVCFFRTLASASVIGIVRPIHKTLSPERAMTSSGESKMPRQQEENDSSVP